MGRRSSGETGHQISGIDIQPDGDANDVVKAQVPLSAFDLSDEGPVDSAERRKRFLAQAESLPPLPDTLAECRCCEGDRRCHARQCQRTNTVRLEPVHPN